MKLSKGRIYLFQNLIFSWWAGHKRDLPWRRTNDPYNILVSEVMLQQTQVARVIRKYAEFMHVYPTIKSLAKASPAHVLKIWRGMGYNRRALYLHELAKIIVQKNKGKFPKTLSELVKLPGVGTYTARAILVFAFKQPVAMVDTNIRKIITHFFFHDKPQTESIVQRIADELLPKEKSWEWHQALMDYGASKKLKVHKVIKSKPFKGSNRFYRGRIVDRLREGDIEESRLIEELAVTYQKPRSFLRNILAGLERDGLIAQAGEHVVRLPE